MDAVHRLNGGGFSVAAATESLRYSQSHSRECPKKKSVASSELRGDFSRGQRGKSGGNVPQG